MSALSFVHLRLRAQLSIVDSMGDTVALVANNDQAALAITLLSNLFGFVKSYKTARAKGIKPVCGVDAWIKAIDPAREPSRPIFLAKSHAGCLKLCQWLTRAFRDNQQRCRALIKREWIADAAATEGVAKVFYAGVLPANYRGWMTGLSASNAGRQRCVRRRVLSPQRSGDWLDRLSL